MSASSQTLVRADLSIVAIVDIQQKLLPVIQDADELMSATRLLMDVAHILSIPVCVSEQYPKGLGATVPQIREHPSILLSAEKQRFSAANLLTDICQRFPERPQIIIAGIESHICVLQTALELKDTGFSVFVVQDAISSRHRCDHENAIARLSNAGVSIVAAESVVFEWCERAGTPEFRKVSQLVRARNR